jgi:hypothetical protein
MEKRLEHFLRSATEHGWKIIKKAQPNIALCGEVSQRFPVLPDDYRYFLERVASCANAGQAVWFNCEGEFNGDVPELAFSWNDFEKMSSEWSEGDEQVTRFWANHLPIMMSVHSDYAYVALQYEGDQCRSVVWGWAPEFEEAAVCAETFAEFIDRLTVAIRDGSDSGLIASFL